VVLIALALALAAAAAACVPSPAAGPPAGGVVGDIINRHNAARADAGLPGFSVDPGMNAHAQFHADRLASGAGAGASCYIGHSSELGAWYAGSYAAENVGCIGPCPSDGAGFLNGWLNSPPHRANILNGRYGFIGVGVACNGHVMFAVVHFRS
jgi:uncharacterized protein YkwD